MDFKNREYIIQYLAEKANQINQVIIDYLPKEGIPSLLAQSMEYSLLAGGKRIRPIFSMVTYESFGKEGNDVLSIVINLELLHTYSLIHDDLPAMDDDDYRRGKLTNHKVFGEALAILSGDALLTLAFENMAKALRNFHHLSADVRLQMMEEFAKYSGAGGMVGGQVLDSIGEQGISSFEELLYVHTHKTGDLLVYSIRLGALLAGADEIQLQRLTEFGRKIGLAFQIQDDILDVIGDSQILGKTVGSDQNNLKITYPYFKGIEESKYEVERLVSEAKDLIENIGIKTEHLFEIADYMVFRNK
ncbi:polyprenyl synthetase family protein [Tepidibacillus marianensis]|uniref:polyprenyl synthetase family protein n=1 Tax=Tepidibacillus marianensis TaxID=3131995 RepID=UPI0030D079CE